MNDTLHSDPTANPNFLTKIRTIPVRTLAALGFTGVLLAGCTADSGESEPRGNTAAATSSSTAESAPSGTESTVKTNNTEPLCEGSPDVVSLDLQEGQVVVDGACDPDPSAPVGIYPEATQQAQSIDQVETGDVLEAECVQNDGQERANTQEKSTAWVRVSTDNGTGMIPEVWVRGEESLSEC